MPVTRVNTDIGGWDWDRRRWSKVCSTHDFVKAITQSDGQPTDDTCLWAGGGEVFGNLFSSRNIITHNLGNLI